MDIGTPESKKPARGGLGSVRDFGVDAGGSVGIHAERVPAIQALEVVENVVIDEIAEGGTGRPASDSAYDAPK